MFETRNTTLEPDLAPDLPEHWGWLLVIGGASLMAGLLAILAPGFTAFAVELLIGSLLVLEGVLEGVHAFRVHRRSGFAGRLLGAVLAFVIGGLLLGYPVAGVLSLTLLVGIFFLAAGLFKLMIAWELRSHQAGGWLGFHGALSSFLGVLILGGWPWAAPGVLGLLVGVDLMCNGWWLLMLSLASWRASTHRSR